MLKYDLFALCKPRCNHGVTVISILLCIHIYVSIHMSRISLS